MKKLITPPHIIILILFIFTVFIRFFNLETTARFTRDESSDLIAIKNIFDHRNITLIGSQAEGNVAIFSSLSFYLSLPFAALAKFDPIGPAWAAAFFGTIALILLWLVYHKTKPPLLFYLLSTVIFPYLQSSRWAWNPHFIPFIQALALFIYFTNLPLKFFIVGILLGLTIHLHWYAAFTVISSLFLILFFTKSIRKTIYTSIGVIISILPFAIFDLTHPPGLFLSRFLYFSPIAQAASSTITPFVKFIQAWPQLFTYLSAYQYTTGLIVLSLSTLLAISNFINHKANHNLFLIPPFFQILCLTLISSPIADRYFIPVIIFYILWLNQSYHHYLAKIIVIVLLLVNIFSLPKTLNQNDYTNNIKALNNITQIISQNYQNQPFNLVVLQSQDSNTKGTRFRDLLELKNIHPLSPDNYDGAKTLFIISQSSWDNINSDPAYEMSHFRQPTPDNAWKINNSVWTVYKSTYK